MDLRVLQTGRNSIVFEVVILLSLRLWTTVSISLALWISRLVVISLVLRIRKTGGNRISHQDFADS